MFRRRQRLFVEMEQMASRPFSQVNIVITKILQVFCHILIAVRFLFPRPLRSWSRLTTRTVNTMRLHRASTARMRRKSGRKIRRVRSRWNLASETKPPFYRYLCECRRVSLKFPFISSRSGTFSPPGRSQKLISDWILMCNWSPIPQVDYHTRRRGKRRGLRLRVLSWHSAIPGDRR